MMKTLSRIVSVLGLGGLVGVAPGQVVRPESLPQGFVIVVEDVSQAASASRPIYMAGAHNTWDPGDPEYKLEPRSDKRWQIVIDGGEFGLNSEFKFTLGGWASAETDSEGQDIPNRTLPDIDITGLPPGQQPVVELVVPRFRDGSEQYIIAQEYRPLVVTGEVKRLQVAGGAGAADGEMRDLLVWLPPGYHDHPERTYPVLYMLDGQNLFQDHAGIPGEWKLDETATAMINAGLIEPFVAVGIPSFANARVNEYMPALARQADEFRGEKAMADRFGSWLRVEALPRVERAFRVSKQREHRAIGGASLGGLFALYAGSAMADTFGHVLAESPAIELDAGSRDLNLMQWLRNQSEFPGRVFIGMGGAEDVPGTGFFSTDSMRHSKAAEELYRFYADRADAAILSVDRHEHNELAWVERLPAALVHLFPRTTMSEEERASARQNNTVDPQELDQGMVFIVTDRSGGAADAGPIYLAGNHNGWNAGDPTQALERQPDGTWKIELPRLDLSQRLEFKFTRGSWDRVETTVGGEEIDNRRLPPVDTTRLGDNERPVLRFEVEDFREPPSYDARDFTDPDRPLDVTGDVRRLRVAGGAGRVAEHPVFGQRDLLVRLPEGYDAPENADRVYPVLYLLDGQNVFEHAPGLPGEWHADETAAELEAAGEIEPIVIVGIPNAGRYRADEYIPAGLGLLQGVQPQGHLFERWLIDAVVPAVEGAFRCGRSADRRAIGGASLGGVLALHAATRRPGVFGMALVESCSMISYDGAGILAHIESLSGATMSEKIYLGMGGREVSFSELDTPRNAAYRDWAEALAASLRAAGLIEDRLMLSVVEDHHHHEPAWAERLPTALRFLFPAS